MHVLIDGLPNSSLFGSALAGHRQRWTPEAYIAAVAVDDFRAAHFKDPKPLPRPGEAEAAAARTSARAQRWMDRQTKPKGRGAT